jgi:hypothetical protein
MRGEDMSVWVANVSDAIPFHSAIPPFREATWPTSSVVNVMRSIVNVLRRHSDE